MCSLRPHKDEKADPAILPRSTLVHNIQNTIKEKNGIELDEQEVLAVIQAEEMEVFMAIAQNKKVRFYWGTVFGEETAPIRLRGYYAELPAAKKNGGYSQYKTGKPGVSWSNKAKSCEKLSPAEYFAKPEHRFTTEARNFRKLNNLEEIPEFYGLTEEKIQQINEKADKAEQDLIPLSKRSRKERDKKHNSKMLDALHKQWEIEGYKPIGSPDDKYEKGDSITWYLREFVKDEDPSNIRLEQIRRAIDMATERDMIKDHQELFELEQDLIKQVKEDGLEELPHKHMSDIGYQQNIFTIKVQGWDEMVQVSQAAQNLRKKVEQERQAYQLSTTDNVGAWFEKEKDVLRNDLLNVELEIDPRHLDGYEILDENKK